MTEQKFEAAVERMGDAIERTVEDAADRLDRSMDRAWEHAPVRAVCRGISLLTGAGLIAGAVSLAGRGRHTAARVCLVSGGLVLLCEAAQAVFLRRK